MRKSILYLGGCSCLALALLVLLAGQGRTQKGKGATKATAVTAMDLTKAYRDTTKGNKQYLDKTLVVEGKVLTVTRIVGLVVILEGYKAPTDKIRGRVICKMKPGAKSSDFKRNTTVKIQGVCQGNGIGRRTVDLRNCEAVK